MPLIRIDLSTRRTPDQRRAISDGVHQALVDVVGIPAGDRFHVVTAHDPSELIADPHFLGVEREDVIYVQVTWVRGRPAPLKQELFRRVATNLAAIDGVRTEDVCVVLSENGPEDYSWGNGEAQLLALPPVAGTAAVGHGDPRA